MGVILPQVQPVMANFMEGHKAAYPKGLKFIIMHRYWFAALDFLRGISLYLQDQGHRPSSSSGDATVAVVRSLVDLLQNILILSARNPPAFQVPIPPAGPYRDALTSVARFYEQNSLGAHLNTRGSYVDEMFIFTADLEEFEVILVDLDSSQSIKAQGHMIF